MFVWSVARTEYTKRGMQGLGGEFDMFKTVVGDLIDRR